jgi:hypothetical protein
MPSSGALLFLGAVTKAESERQKTESGGWKSRKAAEDRGDEPLKRGKYELGKIPQPLCGKGRGK